MSKEGHQQMNILLIHTMCNVTYDKYANCSDYNWFQKPVRIICIVFGVINVIIKSFYMEHTLFLYIWQRQWNQQKATNRMHFCVIRDFELSVSYRCIYTSFPRNRLYLTFASAIWCTKYQDTTIYILYVFLRIYFL